MNDESHGIIGQAEDVLARSPISRASRVEAVIRSAYQRRFLVIATEQLAWALVLLLGGGTLLLLLGTQILNWYWLVLLGFAAVVLALFRVRRRLVPHYRVAQILDRHLELNDSLSTAWFLLSRHDEQPAARFQIAHAEEMAATVDSARALPFTGRKIWALAGALGAVVFGLFAIRYLVTSSLSLKEALVPIHFAGIFERIESSLSAENRPPQDRAALDRQQLGSRSSEASQQELRSEMIQAQPDGNTANQPSASEASAPAKDGANAGEGQKRESSASDRQSTSSGDAQQATGAQPDTPQSAKAGTAPDNGQKGSSGLFDKMKDAFSGLMAEMHSNTASSKSSQNGRTQDTQKGTEQISSGQGQHGQQQDIRNEQLSQDRSAEGQTEGQTTESAQSAQGRNADRSPDKSSDAHSGVGRQDGNKSITEAEQLKAMGKLEEIIGKRSADLTGEMMVETQSGKQQLKTAYSQRVGHHSDLGGEIHRDEIPPIYRQYVREYMDLVHKQSPAGD